MIKWFKKIRCNIQIWFLEGSLNELGERLTLGIITMEEYKDQFDFIASLIKEVQKRKKNLCLK